MYVFDTFEKVLAVQMPACPGLNFTKMREIGKI